MAVTNNNYYYSPQNTKEVNEKIELEIKNIPFTSNQVFVQQYQIDSKNSNSNAVWKELGSPQDPTAEQINKIKKHENLKTIKKQHFAINNKRLLVVPLELPAQSVCLLKITPI